MFPEHKAPCATQKSNSVPACVQPRFLTSSWQFFEATIDRWEGENAVSFSTLFVAAVCPTILLMKEEERVNEAAVITSELRLIRKMSLIEDPGGGIQG